MWDQNCLIWVFLDGNLKKTIVIFERSTFKLIKNEFLTNRANFGIGCAFYTGLGSNFSEKSGPGPSVLCKVCEK